MVDKGLATFLTCNVYHWYGFYDENEDMRPGKGKFHMLYISKISLLYGFCGELEDLSPG